MASKMSDITKQLKQAAGHEASVKKRPAAPEPVMAKYRPPSRDGKQHIGAYLDPGFKTSLRLVQAQTGRDFHDILAESLNETFRRYKVPVVDYVGRKAMK